MQNLALSVLVLWVEFMSCWADVKPLKITRFHCIRLQFFLQIFNGGLAIIIVFLFCILLYCILYYLIFNPYPWKDQGVWSKEIKVWIMKHDSVGETWIQSKDNTFCDHVCQQLLRILECVTRAHKHTSGGDVPGDIRIIVESINLTSKIIDCSFHCFR